MTGLVKEALLQIARGGGIFTLARRHLSSGLRILAYHGIWTTPGYQYGKYLFITPEQFEQRMSWLKKSGYPVLPLDVAIELWDDESLPENAVVITIDDGWASTYTHMLPVLEELALPATIYMTTWYSEHQIPVTSVAVDYFLSRIGEPATEKELDHRRSRRIADACRARRCSPALRGPARDHRRDMARQPSIRGDDARRNRRRASAGF